MARYHLKPDSPLPRNALIKIPRQPRSIEMVHCILNAGMEIIHESGLHGMTTNRVAERAGISIGSLYQYFANRESILAGIIERSLIDIDQVLQTLPLSRGDVPPALLLRTGLQLMLHYFDPYIDVLRPILREAPLLAQNSAALIMERTVSDVLRNYLLHNSDRYRLRHGYAGLYVAVNSLIYLYMKWVLEPSPLMSEDQLLDAVVYQTMMAIEVLDT